MPQQHGAGRLTAASKAAAILGDEEPAARKIVNENSIVNEVLARMKRSTAARNQGDAYANCNAASATAGSTDARKRRAFAEGLNSTSLLCGDDGEKREGLCNIGSGIPFIDDLQKALKEHGTPQ
jgi:hypothetical protein